MLDTLSALFKEGLEYTHLAGLLQQFANITNIINVQYMKNDESKNAAIDALCAMLQKHKIVPQAPKESCDAPS